MNLLGLVAITNVSNLKVAKVMGDMGHKQRMTTGVKSVAVKTAGAFVVLLSGCQHIQTAPQPIPITLNPTATQLARLAQKKECQSPKTPPQKATNNQNTDENTSLQKTRPPTNCHQPSTPTEPFFILEKWF